MRVRRDGRRNTQRAFLSSIARAELDVFSSAPRDGAARMMRRDRRAPARAGMVWQCEWSVARGRHGASHVASRLAHDFRSVPERAVRRAVEGAARSRTAADREPIARVVTR